MPVDKRGLVTVMACAGPEIKRTTTVLVEKKWTLGRLRMELTGWMAIAAHPRIHIGITSGITSTMLHSTVITQRRIANTRSTATAARTIGGTTATIITRCRLDTAWMMGTTISTATRDLLKVTVARTTTERIGARRCAAHAPVGSRRWNQ